MKGAGEEGGDPEASGGHSLNAAGLRHLRRPASPGAARGRPTGPAPPDSSTRRAARLLRWYPAAWRARYGDEFAELLIAEFAEQPRSWRRAADVARGGLLARLSRAGLSGNPPDSTEQVRARLATAACSAGAFLAFGIALWAQLTIGWEWEPPSTAATRVAMTSMSAGVLLLAVLALLAVVPLAWSAARAVRHRRARHLLGSALLAVLGAAVLAAGSHHFENGWPGTGAHAWAQQGLVPGGVAAFSWAATLSVSAYWAHPAALAAFPAAEIAWMAVSPLSLIAGVAGVTGLVRRLDLSPRILRYEARLAGCAVTVMAVFLAGAGCWVVAEGSGPGLFHAGVIDAGGLVVMTVALSVARRAIGRAGTSALGSSPR